jgi:hypothetical protein
MILITIERKIKNKKKDLITTITIITTIIKIKAMN